jgi:hypothetical protein
MLQILSDQDNTHKLLREIERVLLQEGAELSSSACIKVRQGELSVHSDLGSNDNSALMSIPETCLPKRDNFLITENDDRFILDIKANPTKLEETLMGLMIELYNITNKARWHKENHPFALIQSTESFKHLIETKLPGFWQKNCSQKLNEYLINSFIASRVLKVHGSSEGPKVFMPLIDSVNHHVLARNFSHVAIGDHKGIAIENAKPTGTDEVFVSYNRLDPLKQFLMYGFVEDSPLRLRSIPMIIELPFGVIDINFFKPEKIRNLVSKSHFPGELVKLLPNMAMVEKTHLKLSSLFMPTQHTPMILKKVLTCALALFDKNQIELAGGLEACVALSEQQVFAVNQRYAEELSVSCQEMKSNCQSEFLIAQLDSLVEKHRAVFNTM